MLNSFRGTYTQSELDQACSLLDSEVYQPPVFDRNSLAAYAIPLAELDRYKRIRVLAAKHIAAAHGVNQVRLLELHKILSIVP